MIIFLLLSLPTIITTIPAFRWPLIRLYMGVDVDLLLVGFKVGETALIGTYSFLYAMEKVQLIRDILKTSQSLQKSYADVRRRKLEFQVGDWVFLKVSPMKRVMRFRKKGKLSPRYVGPYKILERVGKVAYELELLAELAAVHPVFHI